MVLGFLAALVMQAVPSAQEAAASTGTSKPAPRENPQPWVTDDDYPSASLGRREFGTVKFRLDLDARGNPTGCHVTGSSGYSDLDMRACKLLQKRARFVPVRDATGKGVSGPYDGSFSWNIPGHVRHNPVSDLASEPVGLAIGVQAVPKNYASPATLRMVFADNKVKDCSVELSTGNPKLDEIACAQARAQIPPLRIEGSRFPQPDSRMVEVRFEVTK